MPQPRLVHLQEEITETWAAMEFDRDLCARILELYDIEDEMDWQDFVLEREKYGRDDDELQWKYDICYARTTFPALHKIDPELQYFRQILGPVVRQYNEKWQKQLERYGFTSSTSRPVLPVHLLEDCSDANTVFDETRRSFLWSSCPIPALLQTCKESREMMRLAGYELIFRTRRSTSRTWFNSRHDILYLTPNEDPWSTDYEGFRSIDGGPWSIGQLAPSDLNRVERLALGYVFNFNPKCLLAAVQLFRNLKELLLVISQQESTASENHHPSLGRDEWNHIELETDLWGYLDFEEVDLYTNGVDPFENPAWYCLCFLLEICSDEKKLRRYRHFRSSRSCGFWPQVTGEIEEWLQRQKKDKLANGGMAWSVPKVRIVHAVTREQARRIMWHRYLHTSVLRDAEYNGKLLEAGEAGRMPDVLQNV